VMNPIVGTLVEYIVRRLNEQEITPTRTQVAKLLYLVDVEYFRYYRKIISGLQWRFLHYGPYAVEIEPLLKKLDIDEQEITTGKQHKAFLYKGKGPEDASTMPTALRILINTTVDEWGGQNLYSLLDYVYYETEPMAQASRGDLLDFSFVLPPPPVEAVTHTAVLSEATHAELAQKYKSIRELASRIVTWHPPPYDEVYFQAMSTMNAEDNVLQCLPFLGGVTIQKEAEISLSNQQE